MSSDEETAHGTHVKLSLEGPSLDYRAPQSDSAFCGPALPPHMIRKEVESPGREKFFGPTLPHYISPDETKSQEKALTNSAEKDEVLIGPTLPEHLRCNRSASEDEGAQPCDTDDSFGPPVDLMATGDVDGFYKLKDVQKSVEKAPQSSVVKRETWMTELPEKKRANFGLVPRHFKSHVQTEKECDGSSWTDTPADKNKKHSSKKDHKEILKAKRLEERDKQMEKLARKAAKKLRKQESLLEIHLKNMKKKKKKEMKEKGTEVKTVPERRPFDRNIDLQVRKFNENQKRAIINKSLFLNDRFASGQSKFL